MEAGKVHEGRIDAWLVDRTGDLGALEVGKRALQDGFMRW
jgi:hypothetical protein